MSSQKKPVCIHALGPTCVGKGFTWKLFHEAFASSPLSIAHISIGDIVKRKLQHEPEFRKKFEEGIRAGKLIPCDEVINILEQGIKNNPAEIVWIDGFCRTPQQATYAQVHGYAKKGDLILNFKANQLVCARRFLHRCTTTPDRVDNELPTFIDRYNLWMETEQSVINVLKSHCPIQDIDASEDIPLILPKVINVTARMFFAHIAKKQA